jgi:hypothetical protein
MNHQPLNTVKSAHVVTSIKQSPFSCLIENVMWIQPLLRGHLSYKATFSLSQRWPLNTGSSIYVNSVLPGLDEDLHRRETNFCNNWRAKCYIITNPGRNTQYVQLKIKQIQLENQYETGRYGTPPADIGDLSRFWVSCLGPLVLLVPKF